MDLTLTWLADAEKHRRKYGRPLVTLSYAQSLDGCITTRRGQPAALSGKESLIFTHTLRAAHEAILVGIGTVLADDPRLTVRLAEGRDPQPVILDSRLRIPILARLLSERKRPPWIATTNGAPLEKRSALEAAGARIMVLPANEEGQILLPALLERLASLGVNSLMVEGGARVITHFLCERLVDWIAITIAPLFLAGLHALESLPGAACEPVDGSQPGTSVTRMHLPRLKTWESKRLSEDLLIWGIPDWGATNSASMHTSSEGNKLR